MTNKMSHYPAAPSVVVLDDLSSLEDVVSTCSSTSTITCSVWSSISDLDRSSVRQISSLTFSGMLDDDEFFSGGGGEDDDNCACSAVHHSYSANRPRGSAMSSNTAFAHSGKTTADPLMLSERSLFEEPFSPIRRKNEAPKAPLRPYQGDDESNREDDDNTPRPRFTKSSSVPLRLGNSTIRTTASSTARRSSCTGLRAMTNKLSPLRGVDLTPELPTRSSRAWNDENSAHNDSDLVERTTPRARRKQLMKRIDHVQSMLANNEDDGNVLRRGVSSESRLSKEPPKLPRRGLFIDTPATDDHPSVVASSSPSRNHLHSPLHKKHDVKKKDVSKSDDERHAKESNYSAFDKKPRRIMASKKFPPTKPRRKKRLAKTPDHHGCEGNISTKHKVLVEEATRETPPLLLAKVSKSERELLPCRSRSKTPPKRFATAPAVLLRYNGADAEKYPIIPRRIIKRNRSSEHHRRRGQVLSSSSLASILESDDENFVASPNNSPLQRGAKRPPAAVRPLSCRARVAITEATETSKNEKELRTATGGIGNKFLSRPQIRAPENSWLRSGSRSLVL